jgi:hypothetical protein
MKNTLIALGLAVVAVLGTLAYLAERSSGHALGVVNSGDPSITTFTRLAANDFINGGVETVSARQTLTAATTTPCAILSPNATTTLDNATLLETISSTTASSVYIATSTNPAATTTTLVTQSVSANAQTSAAYFGASSASIVPPLTYVVFGQSGGTGTFSPTGVCTATFQLLN